MDIFYNGQQDQLVVLAGPYRPGQNAMLMKGFGRTISPKIDLTQPTSKITACIKSIVFIHSVRRKSEINLESCSVRRDRMVLPQHVL